MRKLITDRQVCAGDTIPNWYGISYYDYAKNTAVCYPFGVHLLVRWGHSLYWWLVWKRPSRRENDIQHAGLEGYTRGQNYGFDSGYKAGFEHARAAAEESYRKGYRRGGQVARDYILAEMDDTVVVHRAAVGVGVKPGTVVFYAEPGEETTSSGIELREDE